MQRRTFLQSVVAGTFSSAAIRADETASSDNQHPLIPAIDYARKCLEKVERLSGYEATFFKREVVGRNLVSHKMKIKIRHKPFSVYLLFQNPHEGREVIYVSGQNNGKLVAHEAGLFTSLVGAMELSPTDSLVMSENRYPITEAGIANALQMLIAQWEKETQYGEVDVKYYKDAKLGSLKCRVIESSHPKPRKQFDNHKIRLWIDTKSGYPVRFQKYGFPRTKGAKAPIIEEYTYMDLKTDTQLTNRDFDRNNPKYKF